MDVFCNSIFIKQREILFCVCAVEYMFAFVCIFFILGGGQ